MMTQPTFLEETARDGEEDLKENGEIRSNEYFKEYNNEVDVKSN